MSVGAAPASAAPLPVRGSGAGAERGGAAGLEEERGGAGGAARTRARESVTDTPTPPRVHQRLRRPTGGVSRLGAIGGAEPSLCAHGVGHGGPEAGAAGAQAGAAASGKERCLPRRLCAAAWGSRTRRAGGVPEGALAYRSCSSWEERRSSLEMGVPWGRTSLLSRQVLLGESLGFSGLRKRPACWGGGEQREAAGPFPRPSFDIVPTAPEWDGSFSHVAFINSFGIFYVNSTRGVHGGCERVNRVGSHLQSGSATAGSGSATSRVVSISEAHFSGNCGVSLPRSDISRVVAGVWSGDGAAVSAKGLW